ncbi:hypothetical protein DLAC_10470 [Tieghemostelium lacteum]|uniref:tRNA/rRNA methyltransferase SpoU type domain-containing protein n=1 Tax=Tieghemostelium lacteum TaxID=361077 RepID=A0A151Z5H6_TIELA|nr:hypothetical protein DLAC_10470 [Tieghemostelium lacteum]|eukprot:KYQ89220.1 hypothetical protein DLAC_10470 [Tieghemostelium lacteum]
MNYQYIRLLGNLNYYKNNVVHKFYKGLQKIIEPVVSVKRVKKFKEVSLKRSNRFVIVCDNLRSGGNISAIIRSCDAMGIQNLSIIDEYDKDIDEDATYEPNGLTAVSKGSHRWLDIKRFKNTLECVEDLKSNGYSIWSSDLSPGALSFTNDIIFNDIVESKSINSNNKLMVAKDQKIAIVFGNEKNGVSKEVLKHSDQRIYLDMVGMVQSLNVSVAVGMTLAYLNFQKQLLGNLSEFERDKLLATWLIKSIGNSNRATTLFLKRFGIDDNSIPTLFNTKNDKFSFK